MKVEVLQNGKRIVIDEKRMGFKDIFIKYKDTQEVLKENIEEINKELDNELENMTNQELKDMYKELTWKAPLNWKRKNLISKVLELK